MCAETQKDYLHDLFKRTTVSYEAKMCEQVREKLEINKNNREPSQQRPHQRTPLKVSNQNSQTSEFNSNKSSKPSTNNEKRIHNLPHTTGSINQRQSLKDTKKVRNKNVAAAGGKENVQRPRSISRGKNFDSDGSTIIDRRNKLQAAAASSASETTKPKTGTKKDFITTPIRNEKIGLSKLRNRGCSPGCYPGCKAVSWCNWNCYPIFNSNSCPACSYPGSVCNRVQCRRCGAGIAGVFAHENGKQLAKQNSNEGHKGQNENFKNNNMNSYGNKKDYETTDGAAACSNRENDGNFADNCQQKTYNANEMRKKEGFGKQSQDGLIENEQSKEVGKYANEKRQSNPTNPDSTQRDGRYDMATIYARKESDGKTHTSKPNLRESENSNQIPDTLDERQTKSKNNYENNRNIETVQPSSDLIHRRNERDLIEIYGGQKTNANKEEDREGGGAYAYNKQAKPSSKYCDGKGTKASHGKQRQKNDSNLDYKGWLSSSELLKLPTSSNNCGRRDDSTTDNIGFINWSSKEISGSRPQLKSTLHCRKYSSKESGTNYFNPSGQHNIIDRTKPIPMHGPIPHNIIDRTKPIPMHGPIPLDVPYEYAFDGSNRQYCRRREDSTTDNIGFVWEWSSKEISGSRPQLKNAIHSRKYSSKESGTDNSKPSGQHNIIDRTKPIPMHGPLPHSVIDHTKPIPMHGPILLEVPYEYAFEGSNRPYPYTNPYDNLYWTNGMGENEYDLQGKRSQQTVLSKPKSNRSVKKPKCDPVNRHNYYLKMWKKYSTNIPGESTRSNLRSEIHRKLNQK